METLHFKLLFCVFILSIISGVNSCYQTLYVAPGSVQTLSTPNYPYPFAGVPYTCKYKATTNFGFRIRLNCPVFNLYPISNYPYYNTCNYNGLTLSRIGDIHFSDAYTYCGTHNNFYYVTRGRVFAAEFYNNYNYQNSYRGYYCTLTAVFLI